MDSVQKPSPNGVVGGLSRDENEFRLEVDFIKLLPVRRMTWQNGKMARWQNGKECFSALEGL